MIMNNTPSGSAVNIHCKLTFNSQIRRFVFSGTGFDDLRGQVSSLISIPADGFVLKYVDNESDMITLSTNEEFFLALEISDKVLRLIAEPVSTQTGPTAPSTEQPCENPWAQYRGGWGHRGGYRSGHRNGPWGNGPHGGPWGCRGGNHGGPWGGPHGHPGHHGHHGHPGHEGSPGPHGGPQGGHGCPYGGGRGGKWGHHAEKFEEQKMRITTKIEMMKNLLAQMPPEDQSPSKYKLMAQIHRLEGRLIKWDSWVEKKGKKADHKHCKKHEKYEKHERKQEKKLDHLSPEALQQYQLLKAQIASLKPTLYELKSAKKAKKSQLEVSLQQGSGDKETIWQEILVLKERIAEVKKEIKPLKDNIKALKDKEKK